TRNPWFSWASSMFVTICSVSAANNATNGNKHATRPGEPGIASPLLARRRRKRGARGGGGRVRPGRRRHDRSDPLGKIFTNSRTSPAPHPDVQVSNAGGAEAVSADGMDR